MATINSGQEVKFDQLEGLHKIFKQVPGTAALIVGNCPIQNWVDFEFELGTIINKINDNINKQYNN